MRIAVLGAGAMGSLFGARLKSAGEDVCLIDVSAEQISAIRANGITLAGGEKSLAIEVPIGLASDFRDTVDLVIVFTKGPDTIAALRSAMALIRPDTKVLSLQNGLGNGSRLANMFETSQVLFGVTDWPARQTSPGVIHSDGHGAIRLWGLAELETPGATAVSEALNRAGMNCRLDPEVEAGIWEKAAFNAAMNSIAGLTGFTVGEMADSPDLCALQDAIVEEAVRVATARGIAVQADRIRAAVYNARASHRSHKPSMLQDLLAGRPTEIDSINMAIVEQARLAGMEAPVIETLGRLVRAVERRSGRFTTTAPA